MEESLGGGAGTCTGKEKEGEMVREKHEQTKRDAVAINGSFTLTVSHRLILVFSEQTVG